MLSALTDAANVGNKPSQGLQAHLPYAWGVLQALWLEAHQPLGDLRLNLLGVLLEQPGVGVDDVLRARPSSHIGVRRVRLERTRARLAAPQMRSCAVATHLPFPVLHQLVGLERGDDVVRLNEGLLGHLLHLQPWPHSKTSATEATGRNAHTIETTDANHRG